MLRKRARETVEAAPKERLFPIASGDALACRNWLRDAGSKHAADRVPAALKFAVALKLPVTFEEATFNERAGAVERRPST